MKITIPAFLAMVASSLFSGSSLCDETIFVPAGTTWKYLDDGTNQGTAWRSTSFDDGAWASGSAELGYGDGDENTVVGYGPDPNNKYITTYFRKSFTVSNPSLYQGLKLELLRDDGAVVYLNGFEIARSNMPSGFIDHSTLAGTPVYGSDEDAFFESWVDTGSLLTGKNVLAVEIHQNLPTSSDISIDLEFVGSTEPPAFSLRKGPYLIYPGANTEMTVLWQLNGTASCTLKWGYDTSYSLGSVVTAEYGFDHQHSYTIHGLAPGNKYYYLVSVNGIVDYTGSFHAAPEDSGTKFKFLAYGDTRTQYTIHNEVAGAMVSTYALDPDFQSFALVNGDLVTNGDLEVDWEEEFFNPGLLNIHELFSSLPYHSCMGNHEGFGFGFMKYFSYPFVEDRYWSFDWGPAHFVVIDQYVDYGPGSAQLAWIENDLASTPKQWRFLSLHEPGWSAGGHSNNALVQDVIQPLCEKYNVSIVFSGHNHYYARALVNDVHHVTTGGGGAPLYSPDPGYENIVATSMSHHFCKVEIDGSLLDFTAVTPDGAIIDEFTIQQPRPDIKANNQDGLIFVTSKDNVHGTIALSPGDKAGVLAEWWIIMLTPFWPVPVVLPLGQLPIFEMADTTLFDGPLPAGFYAFFFILDHHIDWIPQWTWFDFVIIASFP